MQLVSKDILLLLLSSVLVSSEAPSQRKTRGQRKKEDEASFILDASHAMEMEADNPESLKQLNSHLPYHWDLSYKSHKETKPTMNKQDYLKEVKKGGTFDTIQGFWNHWNDVQRHSEFHDCNYNLFKQGIKPVWEDPKNINGGKCFVMTKSTDKDETLKLWIHVMLALILGEFKTEVNGVVLSVRSWGSTFAVWTRDSKDKRATDLINKKLKEIFGPSAEVRYQRHQTILRKMKTKKSPHTSDNESGGEASSEGESKDHQGEKSHNTKRRHSSDSTRGKLREMNEPIPFKADFKTMPPIVSVAPTETNTKQPEPAAEESLASQSERRNSTDEELSISKEEEIKVEEPKQEIIVKKEELTALGKIGLAVMIVGSLATGALFYTLF